MNNYTLLGIATLIVILNGLIGHFFAPSGIMLTPIVLIVTTSLVCFGTKNIRSIFISILTFLFIALNDISIKLYSGGMHDFEGLGFIHMFMFIGLVPASGILLVSILKKKNENSINKILAIVLFAGLIAVHLQLFSNLGIGRFY